MNGDDAVGRAVVAAIRKLEPRSLEASLGLWLGNCSVPSADAFIEEMRRDPAYKLAMTAVGPVDGKG